MSKALEVTIDGGVAVFSLAAAQEGQPPVLDRAARAALIAALDRAGQEAAVEAVVITGQGRGFAGDLPLDEIAAGEAQPTLDELCSHVAECTKPVLAALRGTVGDAGLALALAAHARLAAAGTRLGFAAIRRGLVPGGGATQRLAQLVGAGAAIEMIFAGRVLSAESGHLRGLFRQVVPGNVVGAAVEAARVLAAVGHPETQDGLPPGLSDPIGFQEAIVKRRTAGGALPPEAEAALECIEAAQLLPLEAGIAMERTLRGELRETARARGLIHATALESRAAPAAALPQRLTVLGDGAAAGDLAARALAAGLAVVVAEQRAGGADTVRRRVEARLEQDVARGRISGAVQAERLARLSGGPSDAELPGAAFVIEACDAPLDKMAALAEHISGATGGAPLLLHSNAALQAGTLGEVLGARVLGLGLSAHPGAAGRGLAELALDPGADPGVEAQAGALLRRLGYGVVVCPARDGLIAGRLKAALQAAALWCVARGAAPREVDAALGWALGPFHQADAEGLEATAARLDALGWEPDLARFFKGFVVEGRTGRTVGRGVFSYAQQGAAGDYDTLARSIADGWRGVAEGGGPAPAVIRRRVWSALFSTGLQLLDEGAARDAGDIDLAGLEALGLPRASGGPMKTAEIRGLLTVKHELEAWSADAPALWAMSGRLDEMIKNGLRFGI